MSFPVHVALVGYGYAGKTFHAPLIAAAPGLILHTIVSGGEAAAADWPDCRVCPDYETALADPEIELIVLATPNTLHFEQAEAALLAGKHVVVDKPFTVNLYQARALARLQGACSRLVSVFHNRRWDADFLALRELLASGRLGRLSHFESHFDRFRPEPRARWREQNLPGSGLWYDLGSHLLDQALQLFGLPEALQATLAKQRAGAQATDYFHVQLFYPGFHAVLHGSCLVSGGNPRFSLHGDRASYLKFGLDAQEGALKRGARPGGEGWGVDPVPGQLLFADGEQVLAENQPPARGDYREYYQRMAAAVRGRGPVPVSVDEALQVMTLLELAEQSAEQGRRLPTRA
nr:oxidoreductase [Chromobacterium sp. ASV5]